MCSPVRSHVFRGNGRAVDKRLLFTLQAATVRGNLMLYFGFPVVGFFWSFLFGFFFFNFPNISHVVDCIDVLKVLRERKMKM